MPEFATNLGVVKFTLVWYQSMSACDGLSSLGWWFTGVTDKIKKKNKRDQQNPSKTGSSSERLLISSSLDYGFFNYYYVFYSIIFLSMIAVLLRADMKRLLDAILHVRDFKTWEVIRTNKTAVLLLSAESAV